MIENNLTRALRDFLTDRLKDMRLPTKKGGLRPPMIFNGFLPPKKEMPDDDFPYVIVRLDKGTVEQSVRRIAVSIIVGCYDLQFDGYESCVNVATRIINELTTCLNQTLDEKFMLTLPITWNVPAEQPYPQWELVIQAEWTTRTPDIQFKLEGGLYGD